MADLFFGARDAWLDFFPPRYELQARLKARDAAPLGPFMTSVTAATDRLWVLDQHFDSVGFRPLANALAGSGVADVRILSGVGPDDDAMATLLMARHVAGFREGEESVLWCPYLKSGEFPYAHDRFAIVDDFLWHFGQTVGGGSKSLTAASGTWDAGATRSYEFFRDAWDAVARDEWKFRRPRV